MTVDQIREHAVELSDMEKGQLASDSLASMAPSKYDVSDEEVLQRVREAEEDPTIMITHDELISGINRRGS